MSHAALTFWLQVAAVLAGVALLPGRMRPIWLILSSLWIFAAPDPLRLVWLALVCGIAILARGGTAGWGIAALVGMLVWARFFELAGLPDPGAPPGLSFVVFTAIAVIAEQRRDPPGPSLRPRDVILHLVWFPKLLAGPIERAGDLIPQFPAIGLRPGMVRLGLALVLLGLVKKVVIADNLAPIVAAGFTAPGLAAPVDLVLGVYAFAFQVYCDFSGYSDIATGLSALVGLRLTQNFDRPYLAVTVTDFWARRWHVSLGRWFRDFVFVPLGGSRKGRIRQIGNLMAVFVLSGLWHAGLGYGVGWGFVLWGAWNGALVAAETVLPTPRHLPTRILRGIVTFHLILLGWVFFRAASVAETVTLLQRVGQSLAGLPGLILSHPWGAEHRFAAVLVAVLMLAEAGAGAPGIAARVAGWSLPWRWAGWYGALVLLALAGRWQQTGFIYAGF